MLKSQVADFFKKRRDELMAKNPGSAFLFYSGPELFRNPDVEYPFRAQSDFYYLTGFEEPDAYLLLAPKNKGYESVLFVRPRDKSMEIWTGERYGPDRAKSIFKVDSAFENSEFEKKAPDYFKNAEQLYYLLDYSEELDRTVKKLLQTTRRTFGRSGKGLLPIVDPKETLGEMRAIKSPEEIEFIKKACQASAEAHIQLMKEVIPGTSELHAEALINYQFYSRGCKRLGYGTIVASGVNATCLHYRDHTDLLKEGDLCLVDAGGEFEYYTADITRTFPISKKFTEPQAKIYDLVLKVQKDTIALCKPGVSMKELFDFSSLALAEGLVKLGVLKGNAKDNVDDGTIKRFFPHGIGHYLGMDVHDVGLYRKKGEERLLEPGMVFTVEPGLYFQTWDQDGVPKEFLGIGVRIEDNILITKNGHEVLTSHVPKERKEIEALRNS